MGSAAFYILYVYINSKVAKVVLSSSCINGIFVTDFTRHSLKLAFCEEKNIENADLIDRENGQIEVHKGFPRGNR